jgi:metallophosphoesterase (TIGR00282 family)
MRLRRRGRLLRLRGLGLRRCVVCLRGSCRPSGGLACRGDEEAGAGAGGEAFGEAAVVKAALGGEDRVVGGSVGFHVAVGVVFDDREVELAGDLNEGETCRQRRDEADGVLDRGHGEEAADRIAFGGGADAGFAEGGGDDAVVVDGDANDGRAREATLVEEAGVGGAFHGYARAGKAAAEERVEVAVVAAAGDPCSSHGEAEPRCGALAERQFDGAEGGALRLYGLGGVFGHGLREIALPQLLLGGQQREVPDEIDHGVSLPRYTGEVNILFVGDVFGSPGRHIVREHLPHVVETHSVDLLVINGENAAGGFGITPSIAEDLFDLGAHVITTGNHIWDKKEIFEYMTVPAESHGRGRRVLRPANYAVGTPGFGVYQGALPNGQEYAVMNLQGRVFMGSCDDPFRKADELLQQITAKVILLDVHGEATSEKVALGWYLDGRVTAVLGTHTHIPTADERVLPGGTAFQTDVGMSGPYDSVIGVETELVLKRFLTGMPGKFEPAKGNPKMCATLIACDGATGRATDVRRFMLGE